MFNKLHFVVTTIMLALAGLLASPAASANCYTCQNYVCVPANSGQTMCSWDQGDWWRVCVLEGAICPTPTCPWWDPYCLGDVGGPKLQSDQTADEYYKYQLTQRSTCGLGVTSQLYTSFASSADIGFDLRIAGDRVEFSTPLGINSTKLSGRRIAIKLRVSREQVLALGERDLALAFALAHMSKRSVTGRYPLAEGGMIFKAPYDNAHLAALLAGQQYGAKSTQADTRMSYHTESDNWGNVEIVMRLTFAMNDANADEGRVFRLTLRTIDGTANAATRVAELVSVE